MIFVSLLRLLAKGFDVFAWHLITLVYPLCASIRAIESNSNADNQKWLIYWVLYPLIILFELPTEKIIQWLPFWAYMKLIATCWLVEPHFDGASYVYENIVRPCFSVNPLIWKQDFFLSRSDQFLAAAQKYIKENGSEALEKLIINKTKCIEPNLAGTQNKTVAAKENRVVTLEGVGTNKKAVAAKENKGAVAFEGVGTDKAVAAKESKGVAPLERIGTENKVVVDKVNHGVTASDGVNCTVSNPTRTGIKTVTAIESKVMAAADAHRGNGTIGSTDPKKAQKKWTCALCKVSTTCEANLMDHFWGNKHKFNEETLRSRMMTNKNKDGSASTQKVKANWNAEQSRQRHQNKGELRKKESALWCDICKKWRPDRNAMLRHLIGRHHKAKLNELAVWQLASSWETN